MTWLDLNRHCLILWLFHAQNIYWIQREPQTRSIRVSGLFGKGCPALGESRPDRHWESMEALRQCTGLNRGVCATPTAHGAAPSTLRKPSDPAHRWAGLCHQLSPSRLQEGKWGVGAQLETPTYPALCLKPLEEHPTQQLLAPPGVPTGQRCPQAAVSLWLQPRAAERDTQTNRLQLDARDKPCP